MKIPLPKITLENKDSQARQDALQKRRFSSAAGAHDMRAKRQRTRHNIKEEAIKQSFHKEEE